MFQEINMKDHIKLGFSNFIVEEIVDKTEETFIDLFTNLNNSSESLDVGMPLNLDDHTASNISRTPEKLAQMPWLTPELYKQAECNMIRFISDLMICVEGLNKCKERQWDLLQIANNRGFGTWQWNVFVRILCRQI